MPNKQPSSNRVAGVGSKYYIGVDIAQGSDYTMYCISKAPSKLQRIINRLMKRPVYTRKIIYCGDDERVMRKYKYREATIIEDFDPTPKAKP